MIDGVSVVMGSMCVFYTVSIDRHHLRHACKTAFHSSLYTRARTVPIRRETLPRSPPSLAQQDGVFDAPEARGELCVLPPEVQAPARVG